MKKNCDKNFLKTTRVTGCLGAGGCGGGTRVISDSDKNSGNPLFTANGTSVEAGGVDEIKMEVPEDHLAREYVQEFVLDHLDPADVKREVISGFLSGLFVLIN